MTDKIDPLTRTKAAGHWQNEGVPLREGRYLVEFEWNDTVEYEVVPFDDEVGWKVPVAVKVRRWAPIHSEHVSYCESL